MVVSQGKRRLAALLLVGCVFLGGCRDQAAPQTAAEPEPAPAVRTASQEVEQAPEEIQLPVYESLPDTEPEEPAVLEPVYEAEPDTQPDIRISEEPSPEPPLYANPLTGEAMASQEATQARPIAVMLNNIQQALPQYGNSQADVIFEIVAEGGITRMLALYQDVSAVPQIGSVRSTRPYYLDVAQGYDAILVHCGGSSDAYAQLSTGRLDHIDGIYTSSVFWRDQDRARTAGYEHSLFTSGDLLSAYLPQTGFALSHAADWTSGQEFSDTSTLQVWSAASQVDVPISGYKSTAFTYSPESGGYLVSQFGGAYTDGQDSSQVCVSNVLVLYTAVSGSGDSYGHMSVATTGSGTGMYCCEGVWAPICWSRSGADMPFSYTLEDGSPLVLKRGSSYVCIVSNSCAVAVS